MAAKGSADLITRSVKQVESNETGKQFTKFGIKWIVTAAEHSQRLSRNGTENVDCKQELQKAVDEIKADVIDTSPLPDSFDFGYAFRAYIWSVIVMTSKTMGHRFARNTSVHLLLSVLNNIFLSLLVYVALPISVFTVPGKYTEKEVPLTVRRIILICLAFVSGLLGEHIWIHYIHYTNNVPSYYYPAVVGATLQLMGPILANDRKALVGTCVTSAFILSISMAAYMEVLNLSYLIAACVNLCASTVNLQLLIADLRKNGSDESSMVKGHYRALIVNVFIHAFLSLLFAHYDPDCFNDSDAALD
ncbi:unnamed protein product [Bursaphelenchus xylophilus]|uniref:(pine wood nematode) hypothetical protein n=1 Tax=Bursaphelenchus xylophilus TaxID=6326 RepID=A0A1I7S339_BURXY|nr:unnamed protein product [Bursaphelenchus xylophilus]CAG9116085.1 unnamed protein product [Bursaphelenchus xylophilus]